LLCLLLFPALGLAAVGTRTTDAGTLSGTLVGFEMRAAGTEAEPALAFWYGPTGPEGFYTSPGSEIDAVHNGKRWVQDQAYLASTDAGATPKLNSVSVENSLVEYDITTDTTWSEGTYEISGLTVRNGATLTIEGGSTVNVSGPVTVQDNSTILLEGKNTGGQVDGKWAGQGVVINAQDITIESGSRISADGQGYSPQTGPGKGGDGITGAAGGGYGGRGGTGYDWGHPIAGGAAYGDPAAPRDLGSGGGKGYQSVGGAGGGSITLTATGTLTHNGTITAGGQSTANITNGGGGSGGSIYTDAKNLAGSGVFQANGGNGINDNGGGSGGRIAVYYENSEGYTGFVSSTADGGTGANAGERGTVAFVDTSVANGHLFVYSGFAVLADTTVTYGAITLENAATLTVGGGAAVSIYGALELIGSSTILIQSKNATGQVLGRWLGAGATIIARNMKVDAEAKISADGQGYIGAPRESNGLGVGPGAGTGSSGGTYGGIGGAAGCCPGVANPNTYGSAAMPVDLGSAGGGADLLGGGSGGNGGGAIRLIVSGILDLNGKISANGDSMDGRGAGGGSGGSVYVSAGELAGSGSFNADAGSSLSSRGGGGGGGRIAVYYVANSGFSGTDASTANGGTGQNPGQPGSVIFSSTSGILWLKPLSKLLHDTVRLEWAGFGFDTQITHVDINASCQDQVHTVGSDLDVMSGMDWDTRGVPDCSYELRLIFRNADGRIVGETPRTVLVNNSVIWHSGRIEADQTWTADLVHIVETDIYIASGARVTIEPGAIVKFAEGTRLIIEDGGILDSLGTTENPVVFTSLEDDSVGGDTNLDGDATAPVPGSWSVIIQGSGQLNTNGSLDQRYMQTDHAGSLVTSETWAGRMVHTITKDVVVPNGVTLTIQAGAVVKFERQAGITIQPGGSLVAKGAVALPIYFTSIRDDSVGGDTNYDGSDSTAEAGDWRWIYIDSAQAAFDHAVLSYGGGSLSGNWDNTGMIRTAGSATLTIANSALREAFFDGVLDWGGSATISNSIFTGIDRAICAHTGSTVHVLNCTLDGNRIGLLVHGGTMDAANTIVSNGKESGVQYDFGTLTSVRYSNVWAPEDPAYANYRGVSDQTGRNGDVSVNPEYVDQPRGNYRLGYVSPMIDAADGAVAPEKDFMGAPRYDDPRTPNTGIPTSKGAYADMGAFEFIETAKSDIDLVVTSVAGPTTAIAGKTAKIEWIITNMGKGSASGPWHDAVYLVRDPDTNPTEILAGEVLSGHEVVLGPGESYTTSGEIRVPGSIVGYHRWEVRTNSRGEVFEGKNSANNKELSSAKVLLDLPELVVDGKPLSRQFSTVGESHWFKLDPGAGKSVQVKLNLKTDGDTELYIGQGYMPDRQHFDIKQQKWSAPDVSALISNTSTQTYYVMVYAASLKQGASSFTIAAKTPESSLKIVGADSVGNGGTATFKITGAAVLCSGGTDDAVFQIVDSDGKAHKATSVFCDGDTVYVTFDLSDFPAGSYIIRVSHNGSTETAGEVTVTEGGHGQIEYSLEAPKTMRQGWTGEVTINYRNVGNTDVMAPLIWVTADRAAIGYMQLRCPRCPQVPIVFSEEVFNSGYLLGINTQGPAGVLPPGVGGTVTVKVTPTAKSGEATFTLHTVKDPNKALEWATIKDDLRPNFVPVDAWDPIFANFVSQVGSTIGRFNEVLAEDANYLSQLGEYVSDVNRLMNLEFSKIGIHEISTRYTQGAFGRGLSHPWDIRGRILDGDNQPVIQYSTEGVRSFFPDTSQQGGSSGRYVGAPGDDATLVHEQPSEGSGWRLTEHDGTLFYFIPDPQSENQFLLSYVEDLNGNRSTLNYHESHVTGVTNSNGDALTFEYNSHGRVSQMTDSTGSSTTFQYDALGDHLLSMTDESGTTHFTYVADAGVRGARTHAIQSMEFPDGTHTFFDYDALGRLIYISPDGDVGTEVFDYDPKGEVTITDAFGNKSRVYQNDFAQIGRYVNSAGDAYQSFYDANHNPARITGPEGMSYAFEYDDHNNLLLQRDSLGLQESMAYGPYGIMQRFTDRRGNTVVYGSEGTAHNLKTISYPNSAAEQFVYDDRGNVVQWTNRRGRSVFFTYDSHDLMIRKDYQDGAHVDFVYDGRQNLIGATDAAGTTSLSYDASDRVIQVAYPNGRSLQFVYDENGRRKQMIDHLGFTLNYEYDASGRLTGLVDGQGTRYVAYAYDRTGRLVRKDLGNGTHTELIYNPLGAIRSLVTHAADGSVIDRLDYGYDGLGRTTSFTTDNGVWTYGYDLVGQLSSIGKPDAGMIYYTYDGTGNRTSVLDQQGTELYTSNNMDQYVTVDGVHYTYDADGNMVSKASQEGTWTWAYDDENRLISMTSPEGTTRYEYDFLGSRIARIHNGNRTEYMFDPVGVPEEVAEFDPHGSIIARNLIGIELVSRINESGEPAYYAGDVLGNIIAITDRSGTVRNRYSYLPFGKVATREETVPNPFTFGGALGVFEERQDLYLTRYRLYDSKIGRFGSPDPLGLQGGDTNPYRYAGNNPTNLTDPLGLLPYHAPLPFYKPIWQAAEPFFKYRYYPALANSAEHLASYLPWWGGEAIRFQAGRGKYMVHIAKSAKDGWHLAIGLNHYYFNRSVIPKVPFPNGRQDFKEIYYWKDVLRQNAKQFLFKGGIKAAGKRFLGLAGWAWTWYDTGRYISSHTACDDFYTNLFYEKIFKPTVPNPNDIFGPSAQNHTNLINSQDPNAKLTVGYEKEGFIADGKPLVYTIQFENMASATAPAQRVEIVDQLSSKLDWSTVQLLRIGFNNVTIDVTSGLKNYTTRAYVETDPNPVDVKAWLDPETGLMRWVMESVNPVTGGLPDDPMAGFLPPNDKTHRGEGYVSFMVWPKAGLPSGTKISNKASIVFDVNDPIETNEVDNTIDRINPNSHVVPLPPVTKTEDFTVSWVGADDSGGSGVAFFDVFVSVDGGAFVPWVSSATETSAVFNGARGHIYGFFSVATDNVGNREKTPSRAQAVTAVPAVSAELVLLREDFSPRIPATWLAAGGWLSGPTDGPCGNMEIGFPFVEPWVVVDSSGGSCKNASGDTLYSPLLDASTCRDLSLSMSNQYSRGGTGSAKVAATKDDWATRTEALTMRADDGYPVPNVKEIDLSALAGASEVQLGFEYSGKEGFWAVDDVHANCEPVQLRFTSPPKVPSASQTLLVTNRGDGTVKINSVKLKGKARRQFRIRKNTCSDMTLAPSEECTVDVLFKPKSSGSMIGAVAISTTDPARPNVKVPLAGNNTTALVSPEQGTLGTTITIKAANFGASKGTVLLGGKSLQVLKWTKRSIRCRVKSALPAGVYDLVVQPAAPLEPLTVPNGFEIKPPEIVWLDQYHGGAGDAITLLGEFVGTRRGKVLLGDQPCKVKKWSMNRVTGHGKIVFIVPAELSAGAHDLTVINGVGSATLTGGFTID
jgi:RHS repeat-associated protein